MSLHILDDVRIASPCSARWEDMAGGDRVRFCAGCGKNVFNLSAMKRDEAVALLRETEGRICGRIYRRSDGTVLSADCPVGLKLVARRAKRMALGAIATSLGAVAAVLGFLASTPMRRVADPEPVRKAFVEKAQRVEERHSALVVDPAAPAPSIADGVTPMRPEVPPTPPPKKHTSRRAKPQPPIVQPLMGDVAFVDGKN